MLFLAGELAVKNAKARGVKIKIDPENYCLLLRSHLQRGGKRRNEW